MWFTLIIHQVSEQMMAQISPSSSIIIVLTDGKLEVFPFELSVKEVTDNDHNTLTHIGKQNQYNVLKDTL